MRSWPSCLHSIRWPCKVGQFPWALKDEGFVMFPRESGTGVYDQIIALCQQAGFAPQVAQEARESPTIVGLVAAGLGVAIVPASLQSINVNGVAYRPLREKAARSAMWFVLHAGALTPQEALIATLAREIACAPDPSVTLTLTRFHSGARFYDAATFSNTGSLR
jgi:DNA-binding transcriptional LysR family regulator